MLLSVIIPAYNVENYIAKTLCSLISQKSHQLEVIVVDDGSMDDTYRVVTEILGESDCIWRVIRQPNAGVSAARNLGLSEASGDYVFFLMRMIVLHRIFWIAFVHLSPSYLLMFFAGDTILSMWMVT